MDSTILADVLPCVSFRAPITFMACVLVRTYCPSTPEQGDSKAGEHILDLLPLACMEDNIRTTSINHPLWNTLVCHCVTCKTVSCSFEIVSAEKRDLNLVAASLSLAGGISAINPMKP